MLVKEDCRLEDIVSVNFVEPTALANGQLNIQAKRQAHTIFFLKKNVEEFRELYDLIQEKSSNIAIDESMRIKQPEKRDKNKNCCPKCKSTNLQVMGNDRKGFSVGKAVGGAILTGGIGALAGFAGKKGKYDMFCSDCGHRFQMK